MTFLGFTLFSSTGRDDSYITYWTSYTLAQFGEIVNYNGSFVEQSSSLLHTLILAIASLITPLDISLLGPIVSCLAAFLTIWTIYRIGEWWNETTGLISAFLLGTSTYFMYWALSGLESTLMAFLSIYFVYFLTHYFNHDVTTKINIQLFFVLLLFMTVRPENMFVVLSIFIGLFVLYYVFEKLKITDQIFFDGFHQKAGWFYILSILCIGLIFAFRYFYFGDFFPQPVAAKFNGIKLLKIHNGFEYLQKTLFSQLWKYKFIILLGSLFFIGFGIMYGNKLIKNGYHFFSILIGSLFSFAYFSFIVLNGGDWMEGGRFLIPLLPFFCLAIALAIYNLPIGPFYKTAVFLTILILQLGISINFAKHHSTGLPINQGLAFNRNIDEYFDVSEFNWFEKSNRVHLRDIPTINRLKEVISILQKQKKSKIHILSSQMGMVPYYISKIFFGDVEFIDYRSLTDRKFMECLKYYSISKSDFGLKIDLETLVKNIDQFNRRCGIKKPDIIYTVGWALKKDIKPVNGYTVIYQQGGNILSGSNIFKGEYISGKQFIAVKNKYAKELNLFNYQWFNFTKLSFQLQTEQ